MNEGRISAPSSKFSWKSSYTITNYEVLEQIMNDTREKLESLKKAFNKETKEGIKRAREDIKKGRVYSTKELIEELGIYN